MFKLLKLAKEKASSLTTKISDSFSDMEAISDLRDRIGERDEERAEEAQDLYKEALEHIQNYNSTSGEESIKEAHEAARKLSQSLKFQRSNGEVYFWLSYIFYIFDNDKLAFQYLRVAESLSPDYPKIQEFKDLILQK